MIDTRMFAITNFDVHLRHNPYPGRGLVIGRSTSSDAWLMIYWIMGRSTQSRNRRFVATDSMLHTEPVDASLLSDANLIIYDAMLELPAIYLVSNGDQTRTIYRELQSGGSFDSALATREHEPDAPHYTPRISAMLDFRSQSPTLAFSILKANPATPHLTDRFTYRPALPLLDLALALLPTKVMELRSPVFKGSLYCSLVMAIAKKYCTSTGRHSTRKIVLPSL